MSEYYQTSSLPFVKAGTVTTDINGFARVVFQHAFDKNLNYTVVTDCDYSGTGGVISYDGNQSNTGFDVTTRETKQTGGTYNLVPNIKVHWIAAPIWD